MASTPHGDRPANRLAGEKSPYLLQHAHNPVDWYPWGEEAIAKAKAEDKPIFLSIGYSTCHWCHVMERESFEDAAVAEVLNRDFVPIKLDREERPDLDRIYMLFVQASTGSGGWPMSVWMTPELKPFFGGTYFPPDNRYGRPGFKAILERLAEIWKNERQRLEDSSAQVVEQLKGYGTIGPNSGESSGESATQDALDRAFYAFRRMYDAKLGGFGQAPKFPRPTVHNFLLRYWAASDEEEARDMVVATLDAMARGGMRDQLGGGFHRYSVDENWFVPHFEKMLYDQAQLAISYLEAYQAAHATDPAAGRHADVARDIFRYVLRDLTHPEGGFYSAEDADSAADPAKPNEKGEGAFYIWSHAELVDFLGADDAAIFSKRFGVDPGGNVMQDPHQEFSGRNILFQAAPIEPGTEEAIARSIGKLMQARESRPRPHLDDKVLTGWNAQMISAFAKGAQILDDHTYETAARAARDFLFKHLWRDGVLLRRFRDGESGIEAFLDDYGLMINALVDLYETSFDPADLEWAGELATQAIARFEDKEAGGFFSTADGQSDLVLRLKDDYDGAEPSGNSTLTYALMRLGRITSRDEFTQAAERALKAFASRIQEAGPGLPQMLCAQLLAIRPPQEIVLAGGHAELTEFLRRIRSRFLPDASVLLADQAPQPMPPVDGKPTVYVCQNYACQLPATTPEDLEARLDEAGK